ncbi:pilus assembly PilX family protein [Legionella londiniensis]|uniref:Tfp pilus assembly protein PilX n=1 Tax=Legionella londiniensis TaxID=45068 RepID=A0A0W0VNM4_9GAMM|nr:PilX N-terminal domain-containing pilus assembly protein [Legionella londiniensis]KTD21679.1 Tfp pilus assembly protein PilX [Legionella londiniensis]STX93486.1 type IV pilus assembly protein PilX [Legionella londiniensis]
MKQQFGATLAVTLILLFVITLLGVSAMQVTHMEEKMSANLQDKELSFNAAETALTAGEAWLLSLSKQPSVQASCSAFPCVREPYQNLDFTTQTSTWWQSNSAAYGSELDNIATPPRYIVEFLQYVPDSPEVGDSSKKSQGVFYYQITARGTGATDNAVSILQTTIGRRF